MTILLLFLMLTGFEAGIAAECIHVESGTIKYDKIHPHNEYILCRLCGVKLYTGTHRSFPHGNGSDGTCKQ